MVPQYVPLLGPILYIKPDCPPEPQGLGRQAILHRLSFPVALWVLCLYSVTVQLYVVNPHSAWRKHMPEDLGAI